jgi:hypothetical protein
VECPAGPPPDQQNEAAIVDSKPAAQPFIAVDCPASPTPATVIEQSKEGGQRPPLQESPEPEPELARLVKTFDVRELKIHADRQPINPSPAPLAHLGDEGLVRREQQPAQAARVVESAADELSPAGSRVLAGAQALVYRQVVKDRLQLNFLQESRVFIPQGLNTDGSEEPRLTTLIAFNEGAPTNTVQEALDIRRIAQRAGQELAANRTNWVQVPVTSDSRGKVDRELRPVGKTPKATESGEGIFTQTVLAGDRRPDAPLPVNAAELVERVRPRLDPPPPPPVARQVSIEIGEADSQVNVVIRERNGDLAIQFGAATERLRENLQNAAPLLLHQLQRETAQAPSVHLNFSSFGSATDAGRNAHQDRREKKSLKSDADFAGLEELTALHSGDAGAKPLELRNLGN